MTQTIFKEENERRLWRDFIQDYEKGFWDQVLRPKKEIKILKDKLEEEKDGPLTVIMEVATKLDKKGEDPDLWK